MDYRQYFYFISVTILVPLWIYLFLKKDKRKDMLLFGVILGLAATVMEHLYSKLDYWNPVFIFPNFPFEDFYYGFIFGGISTELYEVVFNKRNSLRRAYPTQMRLFLLLILIAAFCFWLIVDVLKLNSIIAHILPPLIGGVAVAIVRKDLLIPELFNAALITILTFLVFQVILFIYPDIFINHWYLQNLSGINILQIPIEELLFAFALGFGAGNIYELVYGYSVVTNTKRRPLSRKKRFKNSSYLSKQFSKIVRS